MNDSKHKAYRGKHNEKDNEGKEKDKSEGIQKILKSIHCESPPYTLCRGWRRAQIHPKTRNASEAD